MGDGAGDEVELLARLRAGDEQAFAELVDRYHPQLVRFAGAFVASSQAAEDVAQETWIAVLRGIARFEGRSSLRTWLFQICANRARSAGVGERRSVPVDSLDPAATDDLFTRAGGWTSPPQPWPGADRGVLSDEYLLAGIRSAVLSLPPQQRAVVTLRDMEGMSAAQACEVLAITEVNQRVLLHRGRETVRRSVGRAAVQR